MPFKKINVQEELEKEFKKDPEFKKVWDNSQMEYEILGELVKLRKEKGMTQEELAEKSGSTQQRISLIEKQERSPTLKTLCNIAKALDVDIKFIPR